MKFLKRVFCIHKWTLASLSFKRFTIRCTKCDKYKRVTRVKKGQVKVEPSKYV